MCKLCTKFPIRWNFKWYISSQRWRSFQSCLLRLSDKRLLYLSLGSCPLQTHAMNSKLPIKRVKSGCIGCRLSKKKCDEQKPICSLCAKKQLDCVWPEVPTQTVSQYLQRKGTEVVDNIEKAKKKRTKTGCIECRKSKKKCDEVRPRCKRCVRKGLSCSFLIESPTITCECVDESETLCIGTKSPLIELSLEQANRRAVANNLILDDLIQSEMIFLNVFFNRIIEKLIPKVSLKIISEITFDAIQNSEQLKKIVTSLSASFVYIVDHSKQHALENTHHDVLSSILSVRPHNFAIEEKLHSLIFTILRFSYSETNNSRLLKYISMAYNLIITNKLRERSIRFKILVESFIYHFSVSIIGASEENLKFTNPFVLCEELRNYFPLHPNFDTNPLLGGSVDSYLLLAKVSFLFKRPELFEENYESLWEETETVLYSQPMEILTKSAQNFNELGHRETIYIPLNIALYINLLACKLMLLYLNSSENGKEFRETIDIMFSLLNIAHDKDEFEILGLWGLFMLGLNLEDREKRDFLVIYFRKLWRESSDLSCLKAITNLEYAWTQNEGLKILRNENFLQKVSLR